MLFSEIEDAVLKGEVDAGVIIHENRFTYQEKGLEKLMDLGEYWEEQTQLPIPLGGIVVSKNLNSSVQKKIQRVLRRSIEFAIKFPKASHDYVKQHAQEMDIDVMNSHIQLYVNEYSLDLGDKGSLDNIDLPIKIRGLGRLYAIYSIETFDREFLKTTR